MPQLQSKTSLALADDKDGGGKHWKLEINQIITTSLDSFFLLGFVTTVLNSMSNMFIYFLFYRNKNLVDGVSGIKGPPRQAGHPHQVMPTL